MGWRQWFFKNNHENKISISLTLKTIPLVTAILRRGVLYPNENWLDSKCEYDNYLLGRWLDTFKN